MPNLVGRLALGELGKEIEVMGSCVVVGFDKMTVAQASDLRQRLRDEGTRLRVVKNRLARKAFADFGLEFPQLVGKCGIVFAPEEKAITAARVMRDFQRQNRNVALEALVGVIEGQVIAGDEARTLADMPDKQTIRTQLAAAIQGPARSLATTMAAVAGALARCLEQRSERS